jgi:hypothetical protein
MKGTLLERLAFGVLLTHRRANQEGDIYCRHCKKALDYPTTLHEKGCVATDAAVVLGIGHPSNFDAQRCMRRLKRQPAKNPRVTPVFPPLGEIQLSILKSLEDRGPWHEWCGWTWTNYSGTVRILNSLVKRGLVVKELSPKGHEQWRKL